MGHLLTPHVAILDYGCGNLASVANAVREVGGKPTIWNDFPGSTLAGGFDAVLLPGQGAFHSVPWDTRQMLDGTRKDGVPILGICLGMQLMCEGSEEAPGVKGLGWFPRKIKRMPIERLPHIGWNTVHWEDGRPPADFYFCHSYAAAGFVCDDDGLHPPRDYGWGTFYEEGKGFMAAARQGNLWAVQFHPEKSGQAGLALLAEFLKL